MYMNTTGRKSKIKVKTTVCIFICVSITTSFLLWANSFPLVSFRRGLADESICCCIVRNMESIFPKWRRATAVVLIAVYKIGKFLIGFIEVIWKRFLCVFIFFILCIWMMVLPIWLHGKWWGAVFSSQHTYTQLLTQIGEKSNREST